MSGIPTSVILADCLPAMTDFHGRNDTVQLVDASGATQDCTPHYIKVMKTDDLVDARGYSGRKRVEVGLRAIDVGNPVRWRQAVWRTETFRVEQPAKQLHDAVVTYQLESVASRERAAETYRRRSD